MANLKRSWDYNCRNSYTAVSVSASPSSSCGGVLIPLSQENPWDNLKALDVRECDYERAVICPSRIQLWSDDDLSSTNSGRIVSDMIGPHDVVWVYQSPILSSSPSPSPSSEQSPKSNNTQVPSADIPIPQSYLDIILDGAMSISHKFATHLLKTTFNWPQPLPHDSSDTTQHLHTFINDRRAPKGIRRYTPDTTLGESELSPDTLNAIDDIMKQVIPSVLEARVDIKGY